MNSSNNKIISIRTNPEYSQRAIDYFSSKWGVDRVIYEDSINHSLTTDNPLPQWYLMVDEGDNIIGSFGLITNDFVSRQDLWPYLCALYIEESVRRQGLGAKLLAHGKSEALRLGFPNLYLVTDHIGYYERYGFTHIGTGYHPWGESSRIYQADTCID